MDTGLKFLLFPVSPERFLDEFYEKGVLHVAGRNPDMFLDLFSLRAAETLLWQQEAHLPDFVRVHNNGQDLTPPRHIGALNYATWAFSEFRRGASIVINNLEDYQLPLAVFLRDIELFVSSRVSASAYLTPANARAFRIHFDTHDVIITQIEGTKHYQLYEGANDLQLPLERQAYEVRPESLGEPSDEITLHAGDVLYIPRGVIHVANTTDRLSLHTSIGLHPPKVLDLARTAVELAAEANPDLRRSLTLNGGKATGIDGLERLISQVGEALGADLSVDAVLTRQRQRFVASLRPLSARQLDREAEASRVTIQDHLEKPIGAACAILASTNTVRINFPGLGVLRDEERMPSVIEAPAILESALRFIADRDQPFLLSALPGGLSDQSKLVLARRLIREGLLRVVQSEQSLNQPTALARLA